MLISNVFSSYLANLVLVLVAILISVTIQAELDTLLVVKSLNVLKFYSIHSFSVIGLTFGLDYHIRFN